MGTKLTLTQARWFYLSMAESARPRRWFTPPPHRNAYFSKIRNPGVVLRVSARLTPVPSKTFTKTAVAVAIPDKRIARFMDHKFREYNSTLKHFSKLLDSVRAHNLITSDIAESCPDLDMVNLQWPTLIKSYPDYNCLSTLPLWLIPSG